MVINSNNLTPIEEASNFHFLIFLTDAVTCIFSKWLLVHVIQSLKKNTCKARRNIFLGNEELWIPPLNSFGLVVSVLKVLPYYSSTILYLPIAVGFHNIWKEMLRQGSYHPNKNNRDIFFKKKKLKLLYQIV